MSDGKLFTLLAGGGVVLTVALLMVAHWGNGKACAARWQGSGMVTSYTALGGCKVSTDGTIWVPEGVLSRGR